VFLAWIVQDWFEWGVLGKVASVEFGDWSGLGFFCLGVALFFRGLDTFLRVMGMRCSVSFFEEFALI
jgi:hypothetical protein